MMAVEWLCVLMKQYLLLYVAHTDPCDGCVVAAYEEMLSDILCSGLEVTVLWCLLPCVAVVLHHDVKCLIHVCRDVMERCDRECM